MTATHIVSMTGTTTNAESVLVATAPTTAPSAPAQTALAPRATTQLVNARTAATVHAPHVRVPTALAQPANTQHNSQKFLTKNAGHIQFFS